MPASAPCVRVRRVGRPGRFHSGRSAVRRLRTVAGDMPSFSQLDNTVSISAVVIVSGPAAELRRPQRDVLFAFFERPHRGHGLVPLGVRREPAARRRWR